MVIFVRSDVALVVRMVGPFVVRKGWSHGAHVSIHMSSRGRDRRESRDRAFCIPKRGQVKKLASQRDQEVYGGHPHVRSGSPFTRCERAAAPDMQELSDVNSLLVLSLPCSYILMGSQLGSLAFRSACVAGHLGQWYFEAVRMIRLLLRDHWRAPNRCPSRPGHRSVAVSFL